MSVTLVLEVESKMDHQNSQSQDSQSNRWQTGRQLALISGLHMCPQWGRAKGGRQDGFFSWCTGFCLNLFLNSPLYLILFLSLVETPGLSISVWFFFSSCGSLAEYPQPFLEFLSVHSYCPVESVSLVIVPGKWLSLLKCPFKTFQRISSLFDHSKLSLFRKGNENCSWECAKVNNNSIQMGKCIFEN